MSQATGQLSGSVRRFAARPVGRVNWINGRAEVPRGALPPGGDLDRARQLAGDTAYERQHEKGEQGLQDYERSKGIATHAIGLARGQAAYGAGQALIECGDAGDDGGVARRQVAPGCGPRGAVGSERVGHGTPSLRRARGRRRWSSEDRHRYAAPCVRSRPAARALPRCTRAPGCGSGGEKPPQPLSSSRREGRYRVRGSSVGVRLRRIARLSGERATHYAAHECRGDTPWQQLQCEPAKPAQHSRRDHGLAGEVALDRSACNDFGREPGDLPRALPVGMHVVRKKPGVDRPRHQCRHRHPRAGNFPGHRPAQGDEIGLGGAVESEIRHWQHAGEGGDVENAARSTRHHVGQAGVHEGGRRIDIEVESRANLVGSLPVKAPDAPTPAQLTRMST